MKKENKGFTLIELLVVIAIIAILSTVVMAGLNSARQKGRDAKRLSDIKSVQAALELYYDSCGGYPPMASAKLDTALTGALPGCATAFTTYMATLPINPLPGGADYTYCGAATVGGACLAANGAASVVDYLITFQLEGNSGSLNSGANHTYNARPSGITP